MPNPASPNRPEKYNIAAFFSDVRRIELGFEQTNDFRVVYATSKLVYMTGLSVKLSRTYLDGRNIHTVQPDDILARHLETTKKVSTLL